MCECAACVDAYARYRWARAVYVFWRAAHHASAAVAPMDVD